MATLSAHLESNWPEWVASYATIEASAGIQFTKNQYAYQIAPLEAIGTVPETLKQILTKVEGV